MISVDQFVKKWTEPSGQVINNGGTQCVAVFNQQGTEVVGAGWIGTNRTNYAIDLWTEFGSDSDYRFYNRVAPDQPAQKGDSAIWSHYNGGNNLAHVALVIEDLGSSLKCLTQNPGPVRIESLTKNGLAGYLRPKNLVTPSITNIASTNGTYAVKTSIPGYINSDDAINNKNSNSRVAIGLYSIFSSNNGMINITNQPNQPGWWINPGDNVIKTAPKPSPAKIVHVSTPKDVSNHKNSNGTFTVRHTVPGYVTANDAMSGHNSNSVVPVGTYAIFNEWAGAVNVTRVAGQPGWWINPKV